MDLQNGKIYFEDDGREYYYSPESYNQGGSWITADGTNEILFWNKGTANVLINNSIPLGPLDFISLNGHRGEVDTTKYSVSFNGAGTNLLLVIRKVYI